MTFKGPVPRELVTFLVKESLNGSGVACNLSESDPCILRQRNTDEEEKAAFSFRGKANYRREPVSPLFTS